MAVAVEHAAMNGDIPQDKRESAREEELPAELDVPLVSPALQRLLDEVRLEDNDVPRGYNRTFNRHNR